MNIIIPLTEARNTFPRLVDEVKKLSTHFIVTKKGKPEAVILSNDEYESLIETLDVLSDPKLMASLKESEKDVKAGRVRPYEEIAKELGLR